MKKSILLLATVVLAFCIHSSAQSSKRKAEQLAADFSKEKHKTKEKNGVVTKKDIKVVATPDIRQNVVEYSATYELEGFNQFLTLDQQAGVWRGVYTEQKKGETITLATLKNIAIENALLTATLVGSDGKEKPFEAVFITRAGGGYDSKGLGFKSLVELSNGMSFDRAYFTRKEL